MPVKITHINPLFTKKYNIKKGDCLTSINGHLIKDYLDYYYYSSVYDEIEIIFESGTKTKKIVTRSDKLEITLEDFKIKSCGNKCVFCFCDQDPSTSRKSLLFKDEDYRMSFLYGNYVTLSNMTEKDYKKIFSQKMSPLYISVHSTNDSIRKKMLGCNYKFSVLKKLKEIAEHKIEMHLQIVVVPEYNFDDLESTLNDLMKFYPAVQSIAVVPVGLTKFREGLVKIRKLSKEEAVRIVELIQKISEKKIKFFQENIIYLSDEFYVVAQKRLPSYKSYGNFDQLENGVGMLVKFRSDFNKLLKNYKHKLNKQKDFVLVTGKITEVFFKNLMKKLKKSHGVQVKVLPVLNDYFGEDVTVTGLLGGKDICDSLEKTQIPANTLILLPDITLRYEKDIFIDDFSLKDLKKKFNIKVIKTNPEDLIKVLLK